MPVVPARLTALLLAAALAGTASIACTESDGSDGPSAQVTHPKATSSTAAPPPETTTTTAPLTPEAKVEAAFLRAVAISKEAAMAPDGDDSQIVETRTGASLALVQRNLAQYRSEGIHVTYQDDRPPVPSVEVVEFRSPAIATVTFCIVEDGRQVRTKDLKVLDDDVSSERNRAELRFEGGAWKIASQRGLDRWLDDQGCER
ncbi:hypothetical protein BH10ACT1_BH10ACT1_35000 [soil metagenome]